MIYVTSDLHGYPVEDFKALLQKAEFSDDDFCYVLGDVIDRGSECVELLEWISCQPNMELLLGNHEAMMLMCDFLFKPVTEETVAELTEQQLDLFSAWQENGGDTTVQGLKMLSPDRIDGLVEYLRESPVYTVVTAGEKDFLLVHSGLENFDKSRPLSSYTANEMIWCRPTWDDRYFDNAITVFGHTPTLAFGPEYKGRMVQTDTWIDIDTGAACGLHPMLLRLDDLQPFYVDE